jgi:peptidoglycan/xylan/chitin deacetylase (PgdA/CDA1 family)
VSVLGRVEDADAFFPYSPIVDRPPIRWPGGARVAFWIAPNVELYEFRPLPNEHRRFYRRVPEPDVALYGYTQYANRVGFWRLLELFDRYRFRPTVSLNVAVLTHFPEVRDAMVERDWAFMTHGTYNTRFMFGLGEDEERAFLRENAETVRHHTGKPLKGFFGPGVSLTRRTPRLLAEEGYLYSCDWYIDDQPFPLETGANPLVSVPYSWELNDGLLMSYLAGRYEADYFLQICKDQFDTLYREGAESGRVMCVAIHPMCFGAPHRLRYLDALLDYVLGHEGVWATTADEIAEHYLAQHYDEVAAYVRAAR